MSRLSRILLALMLPPWFASAALAAEVKLADGTMLSDKPYFIVTYVEVLPGKAEEAAKLIKKQAADSAKDQGLMRFEALQRTGDPTQFMLLEAWADPDARAGHAKAEHTLAFRKALQPLLMSPYDERAHVALAAGDPAKLGKGDTSTVYVVTHVDIIPTEQIPPCKRQVKETGPCGLGLVKQLVADSRDDAGMLRFDALTQANRPNHMTVVEMWKSEKDRNAHLGDEKVTGFRDSLYGMAPGAGLPSDATFLPNPLTGSLYDERIYKSLE
jgi:quinol monooxygenase YgiN